MLSRAVRSILVVMRQVRRDRDKPLYRAASVAIAASFVLLHETVRRFTGLPETTGLLVAFALCVVLVGVPVLLTYWASW